MTPRTSPRGWPSSKNEERKPARVPKSKQGNKGATKEHQPEQAPGYRYHNYGGIGTEHLRGDNHLDTDRYNSYGGIDPRCLRVKIVLFFYYGLAPFGLVLGDILGKKDMCKYSLTSQISPPRFLITT